MFVNTIINYIILITAERLLKLKSRAWRVVIAAFVGALFTLTVFLDIRSFPFSLLIRLISTLAISAVAFRFASFREYAKNTLFTLLTSCLFSGVMICIYQLFRPPDMLIINDIVYFEIDPLVLIAVTAVIYVILYIAERIFGERIKRTVVRLEAEAGDTQIKCFAKIDTGCDLREPFSSSPVIITDSSLIKTEDRSDRRVIPYKTINGASLMYAVKADSVIINDIKISKEVYIAAGRVNSRSYSAIINSDIIR